jgi:hypothetical protein
MDYLFFDVSEGTDDVITLEALASTRAAEHDAVLAEAQRVLDWAWRHYPDTHGRMEEGMEWDHDLQDVVEPGGWHAVTLTLTGTPAFADALLAAFGDPEAA